VKKKKYVFISNMAAPYQVKLCYSLQEYFDAEFWFYEHLDETRPEWWKINLGDKCKIMKGSGKLPKIGYFSFGLFTDLLRFKPDIIVLGGFMKWHLIILKLAKIFNIRIVIMSEPLRYVENDDNQSIELLTKQNSEKKLNLAKKLFNNADLYLGMGEIAAKQFIEEFEFPKEKVAWTTYPQDIEEYYKHPLREKKKGDTYKLLFANRLVERYQPLFVLEVFEKLITQYPNLELYMNSEGSLKSACEDFIESQQLKNVHFLDKIDSWNKMHLVYKNADILILPATYSNGNGTIIEASASGMGIVISDQINNIEKHSVNGENCFISELKIDEFVKCIFNYIENPEILVSHGNLSRKLVENRRNENTARMYYDLFQKHGLLE